MLLEEYLRLVNLDDFRLEHIIDYRPSHGLSDIMHVHELVMFGSSTNEVREY